MEESEVMEKVEVEKLSEIESEETLNEILCSLWSTRKTGLPLSDKSHFQSLLRLPSPSHLDPVLASLRSLVRRCAHHHNMGRDDLLRLLPPDLPPHLQTNLLSALLRNRDRWKEDVTQVTPLLKGTINVAPSLFSPRTQQHFHPPPSPPPPSGVATPCFQCDASAPDNLGDLPCLKSMTWTMENPGSSPADRVATISLKLHDYSKSPSGETEVKFQLTRDTLEAMLRSMTYIREQLNAVETSSGPANKKQKQ